ncbi:MAG: hypothetical protein HEQ16_01395 [Bosea sp.]|nr:hypothetical protein [Bosea sp. (in: a-proteobacteria)]
MLNIVPVRVSLANQDLTALLTELKEAVAVNELAGCGCGCADTPAVDTPEVDTPEVDAPADVYTVSASGKVTFSGYLTGWDYNSRTNTSYCTYTDFATGYVFGLTYPGNYCPAGQINY